MLLLFAAAISQIACVDQTCAAVRPDGGVLIWGRYEPIGEKKSDMPREVPGLNNVKETAVGIGFFAALLQDGTVWSWGVNRKGVLGDHTGPGQKLRDSAVPVRVAGLTGVEHIVAGTDATYAIRGDGTLWAWGNQEDGRLGAGMPPNAQRGTGAYPSEQPFPVQVKGLRGVKQVAAGMYHALARLEDGRVMAWGYNRQGAVGDGTTETRWEPVEVKGLPPAVSVAAGENISVAVLRDGSVRVWGSNKNGVLLNGTREGSSTTPVVAPGIRTAVSAAAGLGHVLVLLGNGTVQCWGFNGWGHCGNGRTGGYEFRPVVATNVTGVEWLGASGNGGLAKLKDGTLIGWGSLFTEPLARSRYWTPLAVRWTPEGWTRPGGSLQ